MYAMELDRFGGSLQAVQRPDPQPGPGQVRIRVRAATVNPVDWLVAGGVLASMTGHLPFPLVLGWDAVGEVDAVGAGAGIRVGATVAAMSPWFDGGAGTFADTVVLDATSVAPLPDGVDPVEAATLPLNGLTANQALDLVAPRPGQRLLVTGASGGVGGFAVQLAAARGASVVAVASSGDEDRVRGFGAAEVLPRGDDLVGAVRRLLPDGADAVLDAVPVGPHLVGAARDGGTFVTVLDPATPAPERGIRVGKVSARPDAGQLGALLAGLAAGRLRTAVAHRLPLVEAGKALDLASAGGLRGKVVLLP
jgi:NADPH:quinone reductase-like Zn-dependent oxidoreductase